MNKVEVEVEVDLQSSGCFFSLSVNKCFDARNIPGAKQQNIITRRDWDRQVGESSVVSYWGELASGELPNIENSRSCPQNLEFSESRKKDFEFSKCCRQVLEFSKSCRHVFEFFPNLAIFSFAVNVGNL